MYRPNLGAIQGQSLRKTAGLGGTLDTILGTATNVFNRIFPVQPQNVIGTGSASIGTGTLVLIAGAALAIYAFSRKKR